MSRSLSERATDQTVIYLLLQVLLNKVRTQNLMYPPSVMAAFRRKMRILRKYSRFSDEDEQGAKDARLFRSQTTTRSADDPISCRVPWRVSSIRLQTHQHWPSCGPIGTLSTHSDDVITAMAARAGGDYSSLIMHVHLSA